MSGPRFGLTGLAVMGANLARNIARRGVPIAVHNRTASKTEQFMAEYGSEGPTSPAPVRREEFVAGARAPAPDHRPWSRPGAPVDAVIEELAPLLDEGDIDHRRRQLALPRHAAAATRR